MKKRFIKGILIGTLFSLLVWLVLAANIGFNESTQWEWNITGVSQSSIILIDIDKNGYPDLILAGCNAGAPDCSRTNFKVYTNNGTYFNENYTWEWNLTGFSRGAISSGDIDNDGDADLIAIGCKSGGDSCGASSAMAKVYTNNGTSFNENQTWEWNITPTYWGSIDLGDIDNDGRLDLVLSGKSSLSYHSKVYINNGTSFNENIVWQQGLQSVYESTIALSFIDNDTQLDLIITGRDSGSNKYAKIYINNGSSLNENSLWEQELVTKSKTTITVMDFDNDGLTDLAIMGNGDSLKIYKNNGTLLRLNQTDIQAGGDLPSIFDGSVMFGDINNDGNLDFMANGREGYTYTYLNNHTRFELRDYNLLALEIGSQIVLGDVNNDSSLDIIETGWGGGGGGWYHIYIYINNITTNNSIPYSPSAFENYSLVNGDVFFGWNNGSDNETISLGLYYNLRIGTTSDGNEIISSISKPSSNPVVGYFGNMMQSRNISLDGSRFQVGTTYYWSVQTIDTGLAKSAWSPEITFTLTTDFTPPTITLNAPSDNFIINNTLITFNATIYDDTNLANVSLYGNWSNWHVNQTNSSGINNTQYIFMKNFTDGNYLWQIRACDNYTNCRGSANLTFRVDRTLPTINLISPNNNTNWSSSNTVIFIYNVSDIAISNCSLLINSAMNYTNSSISLTTNQNFTSVLQNANYNWSIRCTDAANNVNISVQLNFSVNYVAPENPTTTTTASTGGSGGGGGASTSDLTKTTRIIQIISEGDNVIEFSKSEKENIGINEIVIDSLSAIENMRVSVEKLKQKPAEVEEVDNLYSYLKLSKTILKDEDIEKATIKFVVNKTWINENNYDMYYVVLKRYTTGWKDLETKYLKNDFWYYYYEAETPGFSYFAIAVDKSNQLIEPSELIEENKTFEEEKPINPISEEKEETQLIPSNKSRLKLILPIGIVLVTASAVCVLVIFKIKRKKQIGNKKK